MPELIAVFGDEPQGQPTAPRRWVECLSGRSGKTVWRFDMRDELFQLLPGDEWPTSARWITEVTGYSNSGESSGGTRDDFMSIRPSWQLGGIWHPAPFAPQLVRVAGQLTLVVVAGTHVLGIDPVTGKPSWEPFDIGFCPVREPQFANLDGNGDPELILLEATQSAGAPPSASAPSANGKPSGRGLKLTAWSMSARRMNWRHDLTSEWTPARSQDAVPDEWPVLADLDGDGKSELIVPTGSQLGVAPWGEIEAIDGTTGNTLWRRRIKTMHQQLNKFLVGPDTDGDGYRDIFVASLSGQKYELFIDALSGKDGKTVCRSNMQIGTHSLGSIRWWQSGDDLWPQLLVELLPENRDLKPKVVYSFASSDGRFIGSLSGIEQIRFGDADADGLPDLFAFQQNNWRDPSVGGKLQTLRGEPTERWRRLGGVWTAAADYNGDGHVDVVALERGGSPLLTAVSGSDGHRLWVTPLESRLFDNAIPLPVDLDGDGTRDIVVLRSATQSVTAGALKREFPVAAVSGRTGSILWTVPMPFCAIERVLFADAQDLDGDGVAEVAFSAMTDWDYDHSRGSGTNSIQHWLAVVSGRTGQIRWRKPLSVAYGKPGEPTNHSYQTGTTDMRPAYGDLDSDDVLDLIVPAETVESQNVFELRALSGRDGEVIWRRRLRRGEQDYVPTPNGEQLHDAVSPVIADLDGDGKLEVIGLDYAWKKMPPPPVGKKDLSVIEHQALHGGSQRHATLFVLNAADGREKWSAQVAVEEQCGKINSNQANLANKPRPILLKTPQGPPLIALALWGWSNLGKIVLLTSDGKQIGELSVQPEYYAFRPWLHDVDGDGADELLVINSGKLQAIRANAGLPVIWEWTMPQGSDTFGSPRQIVGVIPATGDQPAVTAVQCKSTVYGISCEDGRVTWINRGPQSLTANGAILVTNATLLSSPSDNRMPRVLFQFGDQLSACRDAHKVWLDQKDSSSDETRAPNPSVGFRSDKPTSPAVSERPARLQTVPPDPRLIRRPTWSPGEGERADAFKKIGWGTLMSLFIIILPGWGLLRTIERRRWSLGSLFLLAFLATLVLVLLRVPGPGGFEPTDNSRSLTRILIATMFLPVPVFTCLLAQLATVRRWRWFGLCVGGVLVVSASILVISLWSDLRRLGPDEHLALTGWDVLLCFGFYAVGWVATIVVTLMAFGRTMRSLLPRPMR